MLSDFYQTLSLWRKSAGDFDTAGGWVEVETFQGIVQAPTNSTVMSNGKSASAVVGVLFCPLAMNDVIQTGDVVQVGDLRYIVSGAKSQPLGVSGIAAQAGNHCEFNLEYDSTQR